MGKEHYIEHLKEQLHEIMERPVTLGRAEEITVYADAICALHKLDDDHFREAAGMVIGKLRGNRGDSDRRKWQPAGNRRSPGENLGSPRR